MASLLTFLAIIATAFFFVDTFAIPTARQLEELETSAAFSYSGDTGPDKWGSLSPDYAACSNGKSQSPINIVENKAVPNKTLKPLRRQYYPVNATLVNNGYNVEMEFGNAGAGVLIGNGKNYTLQQMHWHTHSEHTIDNASFDAELHLVHKASDANISVIAILYELGNGNKSDPIISKIQSQLAKLASNETEIDIGTFDTSQLWKKTNKYYRYVGSLTTPPCTENVIWHVLGEVTPLQAGPSRPSRVAGRGASTRCWGRHKAPVRHDKESSEEEESAHPQLETSAGRDNDSGSDSESGGDAEEDSEDGGSDSDGGADGAEAAQPKRAKRASRS
ncbi:hypothetical protein CsSME_00016732 [Camellia sinensis var. sinensis]